MRRLTASWPAHFAKADLGDIVVNLFLYMPVGMFAFLALDRHGDQRLRWVAAGAAVLAAVVLGWRFCRSSTRRGFAACWTCLITRSAASVGVFSGGAFRRSLSGAMLLVLYWLGYQLCVVFAIAARLAAVPAFFRSSRRSRLFLAWLAVAFGMSLGGISPVGRAVELLRSPAFSVLLLIVRGLAPFHFQTRRIAFLLDPVSRPCLPADWIVGLPVFLEKSFYYGTRDLAVARGAHASTLQATALVAATLLAAIEVTQRSSARPHARRSPIRCWPSAGADPAVAARVRITSTGSTVRYHTSLTCTTFSHLECSLCGQRHAAGEVHNLCACGGPLLVRYDLDAQPNRPGAASDVRNAPNTMWRYAPVLPAAPRIRSSRWARA